LSHSKVFGAVEGSHDFSIAWKYSHPTGAGGLFHLANEGKTVAFKANHFDS